jgi:hypothetical protein
MPRCLFAESAVRIQRERQKQGQPEKDLAKKAHGTQQQFPSIQNGANYTIKTFPGITAALRIELTL